MTLRVFASVHYTKLMPTIAVDIESRRRTEYLVDHQNFTGYQQVIKETLYDANTGTRVKVIEYTIGHDEIAQTVVSVTLKV